MQYHFILNLIIIMCACAVCTMPMHYAIHLIFSSLKQQQQQMYFHSQIDFVLTAYLVSAYYIILCSCTYINFH